MIEAIDLTVRRRGRTLLDAVSFDVRPGQVTGVLGGTGAGKTVLLRRMVELERGRGETLFDGCPYRALRHPMREVGLLLDPAAGDPDRTVRGHLRLALSTDRGAAREGALAGVRQPSAGTTLALRYAHEGVSGSARDRRATGEPIAVGRVGRAQGVGADASGTGEFAAASDGDGEFTELNTADDLGVDARRRGEAYAGGRGGSGGDGGRDDRDDDRYDDRSAGRGRRFGFGRRDRDRKRNRDRDREQRDLELAFGGRDDGELADRIEATRRGRPGDRIDAVLDIVGLTEQRRTRLSDLTEGMATRLGIAVALLGDPKTLLLDCPDRGLEPEGVAWLGALLRAFTAQGRAALVTGADTETLIGMVDRVLLLDSGYLVGTRTAEEVLRAPTGASVVVRSPQIVRFAAILGEAGARSTQGEGACLEVRGLDRARVGDLAFRHGIPVHELSDRFTGSDPADLVLAACTGRRARPVVPIQGFPDGKQVVGVTMPVTVTAGAAQSGVRTWGAKALRPVRWSETTGGAPVSNVRVVNLGATPGRAGSEGVTGAGAGADTTGNLPKGSVREGANIPEVIPEVIREVVSDVTSKVVPAADASGEQAASDTPQPEPVADADAADSAPPVSGSVSAAASVPGSGLGPISVSASASDSVSVSTSDSDSVSGSDLDPASASGSSSDSALPPDAALPSDSAAAKETH